MLYPQLNPFRQVIDLSGFWDFRFDPHGQGERLGWAAGFDSGRPIAVPASWNDQFEDERDNLGPAWYQTDFDFPRRWSEQRIILRFNSVNYLADVWLNGVRLGDSENPGAGLAPAGGTFRPFEFDATPHARFGEHNTVAVKITNLQQNEVGTGGITGPVMFWSPKRAN